MKRLLSLAALAAILTLTSPLLTMDATDSKRAEGGAAAPADAIIRFSRAEKDAMAQALFDASNKADFNSAADIAHIRKNKEKEAVINTLLEGFNFETKKFAQKRLPEEIKPLTKSLAASLKKLQEAQNRMEEKMREALEALALEEAKKEDRERAYYETHDDPEAETGYYDPAFFDEEGLDGDDASNDGNDLSEYYFEHQE